MSAFSEVLSTSIVHAPCRDKAIFAPALIFVPNICGFWIIRKNSKLQTKCFFWQYHSILVIRNIFFSQIRPKSYLKWLPKIPLKIEAWKALSIPENHYLQTWWQPKYLLAWKVYPSSVRNFRHVGPIESLEFFFECSKLKNSLKITIFGDKKSTLGTEIGDFKWKIWKVQKLWKFIKISRLSIGRRGLKFWTLEGCTFHVGIFFCCHRVNKY